MTQEERKLYDAANAYAWNIESGDLNTNRDSFIAGANWQYEQFEKIENYTEEDRNSNSKDEEFIYGISFDEPIKLPVEFYVKKK